MIYAEPEVVGGAPAATSVALLADAAQLHGAASVQRVALPAAGLGASPHFHRLSTELFYVLSGSMWFMEGDQIARVAAGSLVAVAPLTRHAFAATEEGAEALIVLAPGVERFEYFRLLADVARGTRTPADLMAAQERFDNYFVTSDVWDRHVRSAGLEAK